MFSVDETGKTKPVGGIVKRSPSRAKVVAGHTIPAGKTGKTKPVDGIVKRSPRKAKGWTVKPRRGSGRVGAQSADKGPAISLVPPAGQHVGRATAAGVARAVVEPALQARKIAGEIQAFLLYLQKHWFWSRLSAEDEARLEHTQRSLSAELTSHEPSPALVAALTKSLIQIVAMYPARDPVGDEFPYLSAELRSEVAVAQFRSCLSSMDCEDNLFDSLDDARYFARTAFDVAVRARRRTRHLGPTLASNEVVELLGVSRQALSKRVHAGSLLAVPGPHSTANVYPLWQFDEEHRDVRAGIREVVGVFRSTLDDAYLPETVSVWMTTPNSELEADMSPAQWLARGGSPVPVVALAEELAARLAQ